MRNRSNDDMLDHLLGEHESYLAAGPGFKPVFARQRDDIRREVLARMFLSWKPIAEAESLKVSGEEILCLYADGYRAIRRWATPRECLPHWTNDGRPTFGDDPVAFTRLPAPPSQES